MFLKGPFTSDQITFWIKKHFRKIVFLLFSLLFLGLAAIAWVSWVNKKEKQVLDLLYEAQKSLNSLVKEEDKGAQEEMLDLLKETEEEQNLSLTEEMRQKAQMYEKAVKENRSRKIAVAFAIDLADFYYKYKEPKKSIELLSLFAFPEKNSTLYHLASFQLASYYMDFDEEEGCEKALSIFSALRSNKKASSFHLESDLQQALCFEHLNRHEEALHKYESVLKEDPDGYSGRLARDYKKLLILNKNLQNKDLKKDR